MILVLGAAGNVGTLLVGKLRRAGVPVLAAVRPGREAAAPAGAPVRSVDLGRPDTLARALEGVRGVVWTPSVTLVPPCLAALESGGVGRVVVISSASVHTRLESGGAQAKRDAEAAIAGSRLDYAILRPTMIYGNRRDRNLSRLLAWLERCPVFPLFGAGRALMQPVYIGDVVEGAARALESPAAARRALDLGGAAPLSYRELLETAGAALGVRVRLVRIPLGAAAAAVRWSRRLGLRMLREEQVHRLAEDKVVENAPLRAALGLDPLPFGEGMRRQVAERRAGFAAESAAVKAGARP